MSRVVRSTVARLAAIATLSIAPPAAADLMCNDASKLPNPIVVGGSIGFEPTLRQFAARLSAEPSPSTIIYTGSSPSCTAIASVVNDSDLGGAPGRYYYFQDANTIELGACTFAPGQKTDVAISDVFYESCSNLPQPRPTDISDVTGPAQAVLFVVPIANAVTQYLTYAEANALLGCGVSPNQVIAGFSDPSAVFCRAPNIGPQMILGSNIGLPPTALVSPRCIDAGTTTGVIGNVTTYNDPAGAYRVLGILPADGFDTARTILKALAFQAVGQTQAYYADSSADFADRKNVRDGHYTIWGYEHWVSKTKGGSLSGPAADLGAWLNGAKSSPKIDHVAIEGGAGFIPQCAMRVKRSADGGLLSPYAPAQSCGCAFEAAVTKTVPPGCAFCTGDAMCPRGSSCRRGFCE